MEEKTLKEMAEALGSACRCPDEEKGTPDCPMDSNYEEIGCNLCWLRYPNEIKEKYVELMERRNK
jgi:hypothetical protein